MANGKFFHDYQIGAIRELLLGADDAKWPMLQALQFKVSWAADHINGQGTKTWLDIATESPKKD